MTTWNELHGVSMVDSTTLGRSVATAGPASNPSRVGELQGEKLEGTQLSNLKVRVAASPVALDFAQSSSSPPSSPSSSSTTSTSESESSEQTGVDGQVVNGRSEFDMTREMAEENLMKTMAQFWSTPNPWILNVGSNLSANFITFAVTTMGCYILSKAWSKSTELESPENPLVVNTLTVNTLTVNSLTVNPSLPDLVITPNLTQSGYVIKVASQGDVTLSGHAALELLEFRTSALALAFAAQYRLDHSQAMLNTLSSSPPMMPPLTFFPSSSNRNENFGHDDSGGIDGYL
jgi:hypothetical protein